MWQELVDGVSSLILVNVLVVGAALAVFHDSSRGPLNPAIFPAFRQIESECRETLARSSACQSVLMLESWCRSDRGFCDAADYHRALAALGYPLPPLYLPAP